MHMPFCWFCHVLAQIVFARMLLYLCRSHPPFCEFYFVKYIYKKKMGYILYKGVPLMTGNGSSKKKSLGAIFEQRRPRSACIMDLYYLLTESVDTVEYITGGKPRNYHEIVLT